MFSSAREIAEGDVVIVWFTRDIIQSITITAGKELHGRFGLFRHADLIGIPYGSKVASKNNKGWIHLLRPTPELWTLALPHRTQILYAADIAFIVSWLGIRPGSTVVEAGTGSGSFSHSVARTIGPTGHLHSFEFHEPRMKAAKEEFEQHGMSSYVTLKHQNVIRDGFDLEDVAHAVFLDLPAPWDAIASAKKSLKKSQVTRICCFSPCIEQVLRTVSSLNAHGFTSITMYETLLRQQEVYAFPALKSIEDVGAKLKDVAVRKEEKRLRQIRESKRVADKKRNEGKEGVKGVDGEVVDGEDVEMGEGGEDGDGKGVKRKREEDGTSTPTQPLPEKRPKLIPNPPPASSTRPTPAVESRELFSRPQADARGHTSYLTFAILLPAIYPGSSAAPLPIPTSDEQTAPPTTTADKPSVAAEKPPGVGGDVTIDSEGAEMDALLAEIDGEELERMMVPPSQLPSTD